MNGMNPNLRFCAIAALAFAIAGCAPAARPSSPSQAGPQARAIPAVEMQHALTLSDLTGGDLGIGGGFLIGAAPEKIRTRQRDSALASAHLAEESPAQILQVRKSIDADLNHDGFITLDEVMAMVRAGLSDQEVIARLQKSSYVFQITPQQEHYLTDRGVHPAVVTALEGLMSKTSKH